MKKATPSLKREGTSERRRENVLINAKLSREHSFCVKEGTAYSAKRNSLHLLYDGVEKGKEGLYILELNTQPGMTKTSLVPEQAKYVGLDLPQLCLDLIKDASCNK